MYNVIIIGAGGHAKVITDIIIKSGDTIIGFLDDNKIKDSIIIEKYKVIGKIEECIRIQNNNPTYKFIIAIGNNKIRKQISERYNLNYYTAIHPKSIIGIDVSIGEGTSIMANAIINPSVKIGKHCIINTSSIIEHDNEIENYVHISPNASLGGTVKIGNGTHMGIGAIVKNNITICDNCIVGAGAVIIKDISEEGTYVGVPAKKIKE